MASDGTTTYRNDYAADGARVRPGERLPYRDVGAQIFLWIAWVLAFAFWAFFMMVDWGIVRDVMAGGPGTVLGGVDFGGGGFVMMSVVGVIVLGVAIAYGAARWATRDRSKDAMTEASTAALYDSIERGGQDPRRPA